MRKAALTSFKALMLQKLEEIVDVFTTSAQGAATAPNVRAVSCNYKPDRDIGLIPAVVKITGGFLTTIR